MAKTNEQVLREAIDCFVKGDVEGLSGLLTDDFVIHIQGSTQLSGDHNKNAFLNDVIGKMMSLTGGQFELTPHDVLGSDEHAVGIYNIKATRDGKTLEWRQVNIYHVRDEKLSEIFFTPHDFPAWHDFWS